MKFKVSQRGAKDTKWRHERLKQAVVYFARTLRIPNPKELDITLKLSAANKLVSTGTRGRCGHLGNHTYTIVVQRDMPWSWTLECFAHEMVHVAQFETGRLKRIGKEAKWEDGEWFIRDTMPYEKRPWEIEARAKETLLTEGFYAVEVPIGTR